MGIRAQLREFFDWWNTGLAQGLPARWRGRSLLPEQWLLLEQQEGHFTVTLNGGDKAVTTPFDPAEGSAALSDWPAGLRHALLSRAVPKVLRLREEQILGAVTTYPPSARAQLQRIARFDVDRLTPFKNEDVYASAQILGADEKQLQVRLLVARRSDVDRLCDLLLPLGVSIDIVDCVSAPYLETGCNLIETPGRRPSFVPSTQRWLLAMTCLLATLAFPLREAWQLNDAIEALQAISEKAQAAAAQTAKLREQIEARQHARAFLTEREQHYVRAVDVLRAVTHALPDHAWLHRFELKGDTLVLQGESREGAVLPVMLEATGVITEPRFTSPLVRNPGSNAERFTLGAGIAAGQPR